MPAVSGAGGRLDRLSGLEGTRVRARMGVLAGRADCSICESASWASRSKGARSSRASASCARNSTSRGLAAFEPHFWLSAEWFSPDGVPGVAIPFYLAHPRLEKLERAQMLEVEGGTPDWCMKILRHEAGHAIDNAYRLRHAAAPAAGVRPVLHAVPGLLHAEALQQELRAAPGQLVRPEPSRRGLRRDVRRVADPGCRLAHPLRRLAGAEEARLHGDADDRARGQADAGAEPPEAGAAAEPAQDAARALRAQAPPLRAAPSPLLRSRSPQAVLRSRRSTPAT